MNQTPRSAEQKRALGSKVVYRPLQFAALGFTFLIFGLPIYSRELGADAFAIGGLYTAFTATTLVFRPAVGWALDRFGRKRFFVASLVGYAFAMATFAFADTLAGLYLARFIQGVASSLMWISVNTIAVDLARSEQRGQVLGAVQEAVTRAELFGVVVGFAGISFFAPEQGWTYVFVGYAVMAGFGAWLAARQVPETYPPRQSSARPQKIRISKALLRLMVVVFTTGASAALIAPIYLIYLQDRFTSDIGILAWAFFPGGLMYAVLPSQFGKLSDRLGRSVLMAAGLLIAGSISMLLPRAPSLVWLAILYTASSIGWAMADPAEAALVADLAGETTRGAGYGWYDFAGALGASLGPLLGGWLYDNISREVPFYANGILLILSAIWVVVLLRSKPASPGNLPGGKG
ncbi:MAG TPA: MFS transporter [Anaerolineales bacterium]|nr:MFS transporter [Anaerolineales bacterium]